MLPRTAAACVFAAGLVAAAAAAQDHAACPMAASHARHEQVDHRHDEAGVAHEKSVHHFLLARDGGSIRLEANDVGDVEARDRIREHLQVVARSFAAGDFSLPMAIHDQVPPGAEVMKKRKGAIRYSYEPSAKGGVVRIATGDAKALAAVHAFLRFQIQDHGTNAPAE